MKDILFKNLANAVVLVRIILVFVVIALFSAFDPLSRVLGLVLLAVAAALDWVDGYVASTLKITSRVGGLLDTMGDRITENLLFIFFAYKGIVPLYVPFFFVSRSFMADFVRTLTFRGGLATFDVNTSAAGRLFVASQASRVIYLVMKMAIFFAAGGLLIVESLNAAMTTALVHGVQAAVLWLCALTVAFSALRFVLLVFDTRAILKKEFLP